MRSASPGTEKNLPGVGLVRRGWNSSDRCGQTEHGQSGESSRYIKHAREEGCAVTCIWIMLTQKFVEDALAQT